MSEPLISLEQLRLFLNLPDEEKARRLASMSYADLLKFDADFELWAHRGQLPPAGEGWRTWLMRAGRGYGKTRAGAEWITRLATQKGRRVRIALVGATEDEVRQVMIEGESGLLAVGANRGRAPRWEPSLKRLTWPGGSRAFVYSGDNPDGLRGPAHHYAWCDELAKWRRGNETWDNLQLTLRCGERPRALVTTTPRPIPLLNRIEGEKRTVTTRGRTADNPHLADGFVQAMVDAYGGTRLGRQELDGEIVEDVEGALWTRGLIERCRVEGPVFPGESRGPDSGADWAPAFAGELKRVVIGVDPPASAAGTCGIVACGLGADGLGYVLGDHSVSGVSPEGWARAVAYAAELHGADRVVAESNQGGAMVESVLRSADMSLPVKAAHARLGKGRRAEPVAILFEKGKARFAGAFPELEDQLCGLTLGGGYEGPGRSPDRADAMVWAMAELMLAPVRAEPRIRVL